MIKIRSEFVVHLFIVFFIASGAWANPIRNTADDGVEDLSSTDAYSWYQNSGDIMFLGGIPTKPSDHFNDNNDFKDGSLEIKVEDWLGVTARGTFTLELSSVDIFVANYDDAGNIVSGASKSGTWATDPSSYTINFYVVKAANNYAMYYVNPADNTGSWSTYDLWNAGYGGKGGLEISHFTGYNSQSSEIPEPATMLLFGAGLVGIAGFRMRRNQK